MQINSNFMHLILLLLTLFFCTATQAATETCDVPWPAWESFKQTFISEEGRVIDPNTDDLRTTSEGQAYALFFSLVANDRPTFEKLFNWSEKNLAGGDMTTNLPAWLWGKNDSDNWAVLDSNSASDADLWMAYTLGEAGRLWVDRRYVALSSLMADRILSTETKEVPKLGLVLLPGKTGFIPSDHRVRLNPSYVPLQLLRWFSAHSKDPRWVALTNSSLQIIVSASPKGYAPDWTLFDDAQGFLPDTDAQQNMPGSYDAIRVYLWAGMLNRDDSNRRTLTDTFKPMAQFIATHGSPPQSIQIITGVAYNPGSSGFSAAALPFLLASGLNKAADEQVKRIADQPIGEDNYYDQVLGLYGTGWFNKLYQFDSKGNLTPRWMSKCK
jgi:endoglucanase